MDDIDMKIILKFNTTIKRLADQTRWILKKGLFSDLEIKEICKQMNKEEYTQRQSPKRCETVNIASRTITKPTTTTSM